MNMIAYFRACRAALSGQTDIGSAFTGRDRNLSFTAVGLSVLCWYVCAAAILKQRTLLTGAENNLNIAAFFMIAGLYGLMFPLCAWGFTTIFRRESRFDSWVTLRHWTVFFMSLAAATSALLFLIGFVPFAITNAILFVLYLGVLVVDIRLAQTVGGFQWGTAILAGCIITALGFSAVLFGLARLV